MNWLLDKQAPDRADMSDALERIMAVLRKVDAAAVLAALQDVDARLEARRAIDAVWDLYVEQYDSLFKELMETRRLLRDLYTIITTPDKCPADRAKKSLRRARRLLDKGKEELVV